MYSAWVKYYYLKIRAEMCTTHFLCNNNYVNNKMRHYEAKESYAWCFQRIKCYITSVLQHQNKTITVFVLHLLMFFCCVQNMKTRWYWMWKHWSTNLCRASLSFTPCSTNSLEQILLLKHYLTGRYADRIWTMKHLPDHSQIHDSQHVWPTQFRYHTTEAKCDHLIKKTGAGTLTLTCEYSHKLEVCK